MSELDDFEPMDRAYESTHGGYRVADADDHRIWDAVVESKGRAPESQATRSNELEAGLVRNPEQTSDKSPDGVPPPESTLGWSHDVDVSISALGPKGLDEIKRGVEYGRRAVNEHVEARILDDFSSSPIVDLQDMSKPGKDSNEIYIAILLDNSVGVLKTMDGARTDARDSVPEGSECRREVAAYELDEVLGFDLVPKTVMRYEDIPGLEVCSLQKAVQMDALPISQYKEGDRERLAVLDYVLGSSDRHSGNVRTWPSGRPAAIDNSYSFPVSFQDPLRSEYTAEFLGRPLSEEVVESLNRVEVADLVAVCIRNNIESAATMGVVERYLEVSSGSLSAESWRGEIWTEDREAPTGWKMVRDGI